MALGGIGRQFGLRKKPDSFWCAPMSENIGKIYLNCISCQTSVVMKCRRALPLFIGKIRQSSHLFMIRCRKSGEIMNTKALLIRLTAMLLIVLGWSIPGICGEIHDAAKAGDLTKVKTLLKVSPDLIGSKDDGNGWGQLHYAAYRGHVEMAELLVALGADVNAKGKDDWTPLHIAARDNHKAMVEWLLAHEAEINAKDDRGWMPLHFAANNNQKDAIESLLAHGAKVNDKDDRGYTPLHLAANCSPYKIDMQYDKSVVALLLTHGAEVNAKSNNGETPLHLAVQRHQKEIAEWLRQHGGHE
jgi:ankyrin repeat protein